MGFKPAGPFPVGVVDLSYVEPDCPVDTTPEDQLPLLPQECRGFAARVFYPCKPTRSLLPTLWLPHANYAYGYATFAGLFVSKSLKSQLIKRAVQLICWFLGVTQRLPVHYGAPVAAPSSKDSRDSKEAAQHPPIFFSHGIGGTRNSYSCYCSELASQGYVVVALEHADGSSSAAQLPRRHGAPQRWRYYRAFGDTDVQEGRTRYRAQEIQLSFQILKRLSAGEAVPGLSINGHPVTASSNLFNNHLDMERAAVGGHSYGGATSGLVTSEYSEFCCGISLDPWWGALPATSGALCGWHTCSPLLVIGSEEWNTLLPDGKMKCHGARQRQVFEAARVRKSAEGLHQGAGLLHLVPVRSVHGSFDDIALLFSTRMEFIVHTLMRFPRGLDPFHFHKLNIDCTLRFLEQHMPSRASTNAHAEATFEPLAKTTGTTSLSLADPSKATHPTPSSSAAPAVLEGTGSTLAADTSASAEPVLRTPTPQCANGDPDPADEEDVNVQLLKNASSEQLMLMDNKPDCTRTPHVPLTDVHAEAYSKKWGDALAVCKVYV